jgi:predicted  nucleic acid-binding Zn-ribbon protein
VAPLRIPVATVQLAPARGARSGAAAAVDAVLRKKYDLLLQRRAGLAVVEVDGGGCCSGCHVQIPPQTLLEIRRTGALKVCPMCQRMLVIPAPPEEAPGE